MEVIWRKIYVSALSSILHNSVVNLHIARLKVISIYAGIEKSQTYVNVFQSITCKLDKLSVFQSKTIVKLSTEKLLAENLHTAPFRPMTLNSGLPSPAVPVPFTFLLDARERCCS